MSQTEGLLISQRHLDQNEDQYIYVAAEHDFIDVGVTDPGAGINTYVGAGAFNKIAEALDPILDSKSQGIFLFPSVHSNNDTRLRKTAVHEIGHSFNMGEADDDCSENPMRNGEIYSGLPADSTLEKLEPVGTDEWSIMTSGWEPGTITDPMNGNYYVYSIEELFTASPETDLPCVLKE
jgi:hypothetical protein